MSRKSDPPCLLSPPLASLSRRRIKKSIFQSDDGESKEGRPLFRDFCQRRRLQIQKCQSAKRIDTRTDSRKGPACPPYGNFPHSALWAGGGGLISSDRQKNQERGGKTRFLLRLAACTVRPPPPPFLLPRSFYYKRISAEFPPSFGPLGTRSCKVIGRKRWSPAIPRHRKEGGEGKNRPAPTQPAPISEYREGTEQYTSSRRRWRGEFFYSFLVPPTPTSPL